MPKLLRFQGIDQVVRVPDDTTDEQISELGDLISQGRLSSAANTVAREPGRMAGQALSGFARLDKLLAESGAGVEGAAGQASWRCSEARLAAASRSRVGQS